MASYHFIKHHAETPNVSGWINLCAARLLRRHITDGPQYRTQICLSECRRSCPVRRSLCEGGFGKLCNPKVEHFHVSVPPEQDVLRLDVAMDNAGFVSGGERIRHLDRHVNGVAQLHWSAHQTLTQRLAFD